MSGTDATRADQQPPAAKRRSRTRMVVQAAFSLALATSLRAMTPRARPSR
jgi:hypothetical protein